MRVGSTRHGKAPQLQPPYEPLSLKRGRGAASAPPTHTHLTAAAALFFRCFFVYIHYVLLCEKVTLLERVQSATLE